MDLDTILLGLAIVTTLFFCVKFLLIALGGGEILGDSDGDVAGGGEVQVLSVFSAILFLMGGSWGGLIAMRTFELAPAAALGVGALSGVLVSAAMLFVLWRLKRLQHDGMLRDFDPRGLRGEVYQRIPPAGQGEGRVRLTVKGRERIFRAVTDDDRQIESFTAVTVSDMTPDQVMLVRHTG